jgi:hypothetical protein
VRSVLLLLLAGCPFKVWSPPARLLPLESSSTIGEQRTSIGGEVSYHAGPWGAEVPGGTVRVQHGFGELVDGEVEAYYADVQGDPLVKTSGTIAAARAGVTWDVWRRDLAFVGGLGGGGSAGGGFVSADAGMIAAWENCYLVPFIGAHVLLSQPIDAQEVDLAEVGESPHVDTPDTTFGFSLRAGLKVPLGREQCAQHERLDLYAGADLTGLWKSTEKTGFVGGGLGVQVNF